MDWTDNEFLEEKFKELNKPSKRIDKEVESGERKTMTIYSMADRYEGQFGLWFTSKSEAEEYYALHLQGFNNSIRANHLEMFDKDEEIPERWLLDTFIIVEETVVLSEE